MDVLVALCEEPNTIVSAEQLLEQCWGSTLYGDNPVHKTIAQLRKLLGDSSATPLYIETIRKRGYRTIAEVQHIAVPTTGTWQQSPFRGLLAFDEQHASIFFGRNDAIFSLTQRITQKIEHRAALELVVILGPSGSGKTSLVRAGLLPCLLQPGNNLHVVSNSNFDLAEKGEHSLLASLASMLLDLSVNDEGIFPTFSAATLALALQDDMDGVVATLRHSLADLAGDAKQRHLLFVDRFEAIFDADRISVGERNHFLKVLDKLARSHAVIILLACRNDFYPQVAACPSLMEGKAQGAHFDLNPPSHAEVTQMIRLPAQAARLTFGTDQQSNARLDDVLSECAFGNPDALPLLQYTLHELYHQRTDQDELSFAAFHQMGGIEGAIGRRAELVFHDLDEAQQKCLPQVLSRVTTISGNGNFATSRRSAWSQLANDDERAVVNALVESRLFVSDLIDGVPGFGVAHEALLRRWPRVVDWIESHRSALQVRARISELALRWQDEANSQDLLLPEGKQLDEAIGLLDIATFSLSQQELALIAASSKRVRARKRLRLSAMGAFTMLVLVAAGLGLSTLTAQREAKERPLEVERLMNYMLSPTGKLDLSEGAKTEALKYFANAGEKNQNPSLLVQRPATLLGLAEMFNKRGDPKSTLAAALAAKTILREQLVQRPLTPKVLESGWNVASRFGRLLMGSETKEAELFFRLSQDYANQLQEIDPGNVEWWSLQSKAHANLGDLAMQSAELLRAESEFSKTIDITHRALSNRPDDMSLNARLVDTMFKLGNVKKAQGAFHAAMQIFKQEVELVRAHFLANPKDDASGFRLARAVHEQAELYLAMGNDRAALGKLAENERLYERIRRHDPSNHTWLSAAINTRILIQDILARNGSSKEMLLKLQQIDADLKDLWEINPDGQPAPVRPLANLDSLLQTSIVMRLVELKRGAEGSHIVIEAQKRLVDAEVRMAQQVKLYPYDLQARIIFADALLAHASYERQNQDEAAAHRTCRRGRDLLASDIKNSFDFEVLVRWVPLNMCLGANDVVLDAKQRLSQIGYRDTRYLQLISERK